ncbi:hypothetical protein AVEN_260489-1 [Araneus ventricosus]|uniref:Uncharacterized protein n=1 Tax=Araneus ventricosus TaxID=182803 RepID=A0A4Y2LV34_ARAVE|nr:hypothetical protein AVEN_260489-1 [Araneus ventricosus]
MIFSFREKLANLEAEKEAGKSDVNVKKHLEEKKRETAKLTSHADSMKNENAVLTKLISDYLQNNAKAILGLPRSFEPRSDDEDGTCAGIASTSFCTTPAGEHLAHNVRFNIHQAHMPGGSSVESESGTLQPRSRDLNSMPPGSFLYF